MTEQLIPSDATKVLHVYVVAPANLPEGFEFTAELPEKPSITFPVQVPAGGVHEGQMFLVPLPERISAQRKSDAPIGRWKDGLFSCCAHGICHAHLWCAFCCPQILLGQVMSRMRFTWLGRPGYGPSADNTFRIVTTLVASYMVYVLCLDIYEYSYIETGQTYLISPLLVWFKLTVYFLFTIWCIYSLANTRYNIRAIYSIPERYCTGWEDVACSSCCCCCTVAQLARHTGDYETNRSALFSSTGISSNYPGIV